MLIGILLPVLSRSQRQAKKVQCQSNLRQVGQSLMMYSNNNKGSICPPSGGSRNEREARWPVKVFIPPVWNPPILKCPSDDLRPPPPTYVGELMYRDGDENGADHSYLLNENIGERQVKIGSKDLGGMTAAEFIVMGEKKTEVDDYYSGIGPAHEGKLIAVVYEGFRHGIKVGSNYLFLDWHVESKMPRETRGIDPWSTSYAKAVVLGAPSGPATKSGNVWTRRFANGTVTVDCAAGTAVIS